MSRAAPRTRRVIVLGSTGSIGVNALAVIDHLRRVVGLPFEVVGLSAGRSAKPLIEQARQFNVKHLAVSDERAAAEVRAALPDATVFNGEGCNRKLVEAIDEATDVVAAVVGSAGLPAAVAAAKRGLRICLANKETLVAAGEMVTPLLRRHGAMLLPVDSEHSAIFQCLHPGDGEEGSGARSRQGTVTDTSCVRRIVLTASGGPFREADAQTIAHATPEQALRHPTWDMGPKITIDSATMMNKALEIIEAHWLFGLSGEKIEVIVHPESVVHSFVEFADHSVLAQLGPPDMRTPIQYALTWPDRAPGVSRQMDWAALSRLNFQPPDFARFPALKLAYEVIEAGGTAGAVLNAANEAAVAAFLERRIRFGRIVELAAEALSAVPARPIDCLDTVLQADKQARAFVAERIDASTQETRAADAHG
ncbi:MAG: 1-deoxy-D-xylulose-5-phosphate reductoisomerase [Planctomycetes bacterium]|nr:1-deoxy-D-xylulose-5-phosphate reductoisomerase [Planctomycetota bacterium]